MTAGRVLLAAAAALVPCAAAAASARAAAATAPDVRVLATQCTGCHAADAAASSPIPSWRGLSETALADALLAFRRGDRPGTVMDRLARGLSEAEIRALAALLAEPGAR